MESLKVYPSIDELKKVVTSLECTELGCSSVFKSESNLNFHLAKTHKKEAQQSNLLSKKGIIKEFYCPDSDCITNKKKFKTFKLLKQHYTKVHRQKDYICDKCGKGFPSESHKNNHFDYCGIMFNCFECNASYTCYDTLKIHEKRKKHKILSKLMYKTVASRDINIVYIAENQKPYKKKEHYLLPRPTSLTSTELNHKGSQTDIFEGQPKRKSRKTIKGHNSTQTFKNLKSQNSAETQTIGDYFGARKSNCDLSSSSSTDSLSKKSIKTQTVVIPSTTKSSNTSFNINDCQLGGGDVEKTSLGTQTLNTSHPNALMNNDETPNQDLVFEFINSSCQTSFNDSIDSFDSNNFFNCNSETQTDFILDFDMFGTDDYSNMCTQTCDDIYSYDLVFNNSHTQTVMDDMLKSVESQTMMTLNSGPSTICRDMTHMETQTDLVFKQMLEEINA